MFKKILLSLCLVMFLAASSFACVLPEGSQLYIFGQGSQGFTANRDVPVTKLTPQQLEEMGIPELGDAFDIVQDSEGTVLAVPAGQLKDCD